MKGTIAITLLSSLASHAAASFRFTYYGSAGYAIPSLTAPQDDRPITFNDYAYEIPGLELWEFKTPEGSSDGKAFIRHLQMAKYIYCSARLSHCRLADEGTLFQTDRVGTVDGKAYVEVVADLDFNFDNHDWVLTGGDTLEVASPNTSDRKQWIYTEEQA